MNAVLERTDRPAQVEAENREVPLTARRQQCSTRLVLQAAGSPRAMAGKLLRFVAGLWTYGRGKVLRERLRSLREQGHIRTIPSRLQLLVGSFDMVRFWISPASADYYETMGINYGFHQLLRFLDEPLSLTDPLGLLSSRDAIIGHLCQVVHANPHYDLQLLDGFDDGLDQLELQLEQMIAGTHPRAASIGAIVEEPDYHERLLHHVRRWRRDPAVPPLLRSNVAARPELQALEETFGSLTTSMEYFCRLPTRPLEALQHVRKHRSFPWHLAA